MAGLLIVAGGIGLAALVATPVSLLTYFRYSEYKWPIFLVNGIVSALLAYRKTKQPTNNEDFGRVFLIFAFASYPIALVWQYFLYATISWGAAFVGLT
jgi:hypothetical protein